MPTTVDVTFRLQKEQQSRNQEDRWETGINGILGVANSHGEYIVECEGRARHILELVSVARRYAERLNDTGQYELSIEANDGLVEQWTEVALIVVSPEGNLLRKQSLIPPGMDI